MPAASPLIRKWGTAETQTVLMLCDSVASQPFGDCVIPIGDVTVNQREQAGSRVDLRQSLLHVLHVMHGNRSDMAGGPHVDAGGVRVRPGQPRRCRAVLASARGHLCDSGRRDAQGSRQHPTMHGTGMARHCPGRIVVDDAVARLPDALHRRPAGSLLASLENV